MVTCNRAHLLKRSLHAYLHQDIGHHAVEYVVIDDDSTDDTRALCYEWAKDLDLTYVHRRKPQGLVWRDAAASINLGIRMSRGSTVIITHPEVMFGRATVRKTLDAIRDTVYVSAKPYFLSADDQARLDEVDWRHEGPLAVRRLPGFYGKPAEPPRAPARRHEHVEQARTWESWQVGAMTASTWGWIGGLTEFHAWGAVDLDFLARRRALGIETVTLLDDDCLCIHQHHDESDESEPVRELERARAGLPSYGCPGEAIRDNLWPRCHAG
jgi:glycosyl transferase family 2